MPGVFNVSFLRPGAARGASGYRLLVDQIAKKRDELSGDGKLSPGDYDILTKMTQAAASAPGLTADERSSLSVSVADLAKEKSVANLNSANDITALKGDVTDDQRTITMRYANDPAQFIQANADLLKAKADRLTESIDGLESSGQDASAHRNELSATLQELQDTLDAQQTVQGYKGGGQKPAADSVAYIDTNSRGEITKVTIGKTGSQSGYAETNGLYGGLQIYGKVNRTDNGTKVFRLGNTEYSGSNLMMQDPNNPMGFRTAPLVAGGAGMVQGTIIKQYQDVNPLTIRAQNAIYAGGYARGKNGTLYESLPTGGYRKYVNVLPDQLAAGPKDILDVPSSMENGINAASTQTVDGMQGGFAPMSTQIPGAAQKAAAASAAPAPTAAPSPAAGPMSTQPPAGSSRTPAPVSRAPSTAGGLASAAFGAAKGFFSKLTG